MMCDPIENIQSDQERCWRNFEIQQALTQKDKVIKHAGTTGLAEPLDHAELDLANLMGEYIKNVLSSIDISVNIEDYLTENIKKHLVKISGEKYAERGPENIASRALKKTTWYKTVKSPFNLDLVEDNGDIKLIFANINNSGFNNLIKLGLWYNYILSIFNRDN